MEMTTVRVCAEVRVGELLVQCECGRSRPADLPCGGTRERKAAGPIRCAHCGRDDSAEGFVEVADLYNRNGLRLYAGDMLRIECLRAMRPDFGVPVTKPRLFTRAPATD